MRAQGDTALGVLRCPTRTGTGTGTGTGAGAAEAGGTLQGLGHGLGGGDGALRLALRADELVVLQPQDRLVVLSEQ